MLAGDYTICLTNLMRYPPGVDVMFVIEYSLHLMNPPLYPAPPVASFVNKPVTLITKYKNKITEASENISNDRFVFNFFDLLKHSVGEGQFSLIMPEKLLENIFLKYILKYT